MADDEPVIAPRRLDAGASARRVLVTDLALHGRRFVIVEFAAAAALCGALAVLVLVVAITRQLTPATGAGVVFLVGVCVNSMAVVGFARAEKGGSRPQASWPDVLLFGLLTLVPLALALALAAAGRRDLTSGVDERANDRS